MKPLCISPLNICSKCSHIDCKKLLQRWSLTQPVSRGLVNVNEGPSGRDRLSYLHYKFVSFVKYEHTHKTSMQIDSNINTNKFTLRII